MRPQRSAPRRRLVPAALFTAALAACAPSRAGIALPRGEATPAEAAFIGASWDARLDLHWDEAARAFRVAVPPDTAWMLLPDVYEALEIAGAVVDPDNRVFGYGPAPVPSIGGGSLSTFVDCGYGPGGPNAVVYEVSLHILTRVRAADGADDAVLETLVRGTAHDRASRTRPIRCSSTGDLERLIAESVAGLARTDTLPSGLVDGRRPFRRSARARARRVTDAGAFSRALLDSVRSPATHWIDRITDPSP